MDTRARGDIAEAAVLLALEERRIRVWRPWGTSGPCDLLAEAPDGRLLRLQVKCARVRDGCLIANARSTDHGRGRRSYTGLVDAIAIHAPDLSQQFVVPIGEAQGYEIRLRYQPARNRQEVGVRLAADYRLADWVERVLRADATAA